MNLTNAARIARRELRGGLSGFRVFLACLALGVAAIAAVGTVRTSIEQGLARDAAVILGGDAEIELTYRFATGPERAWMEEIATAVRPEPRLFVRFGVVVSEAPPSPSCPRLFRPQHDVDPLSRIAQV